MSHHEQEKCARNRHTVETLRKIAKEVCDARDFVDVAHDATETSHGAVATLLRAISDKLTESSDALDNQEKTDAA